MITFICQCGASLSAKPEKAGKLVRCPKCQAAVQVPGDAGASAASVPPLQNNMPRLRSEAMRATTPVTSVSVDASSEAAVVRMVAAVAPTITPVAIPEPRPESIQPPPRQMPKAATVVDQPLPASQAAPEKPNRVAPPLPPPAIPLDSDLAPAAIVEEPLAPVLPDPPDLDALAAGPPLAVSTSTSASRMAREVMDHPQGRSMAIWIGGISLGLLLVVGVGVVASLGRNGPKQLPAEEEVAKPSDPPAPVSRQPTRDPVEAAPVVAAQSKPREATRQAKPAVQLPPEEEEPSQGARAAPPPRTTPTGTRPGGLTGVSRQYDDMDCMRIQAQHSVRVPAAATMLEVDGQRLPIANLGLVSESRAPNLFLPRGTHAVRFRRGENPVQVTVNSDLAQVYYDMRQFFDAGGNVREVELLSRGAKAMDVHGAPFLLNLMGAAHMNKDQTAAAERKFRRSLRINPFFAPAHLNLAALHLKRGRSDDAKAELELADATNVGNCFGLSPGIADLRRRLKHAPGQTVSTTDVPLPNYLSQESLTEEDRRLTALMQGLSKYAVQDAERGKILNNLAVHFAESNRPELALDHFRTALGVLKVAGPERFNLAKQVLTNMGDACRKAKYEEADEYDRMRTLVSP